MDADPLDHTGTAADGGEDHAPVGALLLAGASLVGSPLSSVVTSASRAARSRGGLGTDLDRLATQFGER